MRCFNIFFCFQVLELGRVCVFLISNLTSLLIKSGVKINSDRQKIILGFGPISQMEAQHLTFTHRYNLGAGNQNKLKLISFYLQQLIWWRKIICRKFVVFQKIESHITGESTNIWQNGWRWECEGFSLMLSCNVMLCMSLVSDCIIPSQ